LLGIPIRGEIWRAGSAHFESVCATFIAYFSGNDRGNSQEIMPKYWANTT